METSGKNEEHADFDLHLKQGVEELLNDHPKLDAGDIHVEVHNAAVVLKGKVDTEEEKALAEKIAASFPGINSVNNSLHTSIGIAHALSSTVAIISADTRDKDDKTEG
jgi:osmotically-inducible protein OsmY